MGGEGVALKRVHSRSRLLGMFLFSFYLKNVVKLYSCFKFYLFIFALEKIYIYISNSVFYN